MRVTFLGASGGEVTGSAYVLETASANIMIDCGLFQGRKKLENANRLPRQQRLRDLDAVVLTHAHLDHTGRLPVLTRFGYSGPIYATPATIDLTHLLLKDSAHLQLADVKRQNRRREEEGKEPVAPLYTAKDVERLMPLFRRMKYDHPTEVADGISIRAVEAGHMLGSASLEVTVTEGVQRTVLVFSGDLGPSGAPLHRDPVPFKHADVVFMESTYGDREHPPLSETAVAAREAVREVVERRGKIFVPTFAIGRTQLLLYLLAGAFKRKTLTPFPIYIDSPMAIEATNIYRKHMQLFDDEALAMFKAGDLSKNLKTVKPCPTAAQSRALNNRKGPFMVLAGAGMCTGGRILHHLLQNLPDPDTMVLFAGFQSQGSLGRQIVDGKREVRVLGKRVAVRAMVHVFGGLSGHAGRADLLNWWESIAPSKPRLVLTHGEDSARDSLAAEIRRRSGVRAELPALYDTIEI